MPRPPKGPACPRLPPTLSLLLVAAILYFAREVLIPIGLAILLTFLLTPLVRRLERLHLPRLLAVLTVVISGCLAIGSLAWIVEGQVVQLAENLTQYRSNIRQKLESLRPAGTSLFGKAGATISDLGRVIAAPGPPAPETAVPEKPMLVKVEEAPTPPLTYARSILGPVLGRLATAGAVVV